MNKILVNTKKLLGVPDETTVFDTQLTTYINMCLTTLDQLGIGGVSRYQTTVTNGDLDSFLPNDEEIHDQVQVYISNKVRLLFDPPVVAAVLVALQASIQEAEWRFTDYHSKV